MFRSMWGVLPATDGPLARSPLNTLRAAAAAVARLGYDGIEIPLKMVEQEVTPRGDSARIRLSHGLQQRRSHAALSGTCTPRHSPPSPSQGPEEIKVILEEHALRVNFQ